jgi:hypothetical protein
VAVLVLSGACDQHGLVLPWKREKAKQKERARRIGLSADENERIADGQTAFL